MSIETDNLTGKSVLEVGSGRGDTTRSLVALLSKYPNTTLTITDVSDTHFQQLQDEFTHQPVRIQFIQTDACSIDGVAPSSIDYLVCNYTLCAINAQAGRIIFALKRFCEISRVGGELFVEEEFPIDKKDSPAQEIWSEKWRILKTATILSGGFPYNELQPEILAEMCQMVVFRDIEWSAYTSFLPGAESLDFFQARLKRILQEIPNPQLRQGLLESASKLIQKVGQTGGMEIPYYRLSARKGAKVTNGGTCG
jgi:ubiquinone/menaquinone biosynthesis C-methylase UbiE